MKVRFEPWGAWVRLETLDATVALDRDDARRFGLHGEDVWAEDGTSSADVGVSRARPLEVHLAVTSRCGVGCEGCYLDARPDGDEPSRDSLERTLDAAAEEGAFTIAFGGGEPTLRKDLDELAASARRRGLVPLVTTSATGLTDAKLERLAAFDQVNVSYDGPGSAYEDVRGVDRADEVERAIVRLVAHGIRVGVNVVLTRTTFPLLSTTLDRTAELGVREVQLLRYKPQGRAKSLAYYARRLTPAQVDAFPEVLAHSAERFAGRLSLRVDCALVPFLSADPRFSEDPARLARAGVFGCEAGRHLGAVRADGYVAPCSFADPTDARGDALGEAFATDATLARFRDYPVAAPAPCDTCAIASTCRGGCKVVTSYVSGTFGPDPECPRVRGSRRLPRSPEAR